MTKPKPNIPSCKRKRVGRDNSEEQNRLQERLLRK